MTLSLPRVAALLLPCLLLLPSACSKDDEAEAGTDAGGETGSPDQVGAECETPDDCYPGIDASELAGDVESVRNTNELSLRRPTDEAALNTPVNLAGELHADHRFQPRPPP